MIQLDKNTVNTIAEKCADIIIAEHGEKELVTLPYDVLSAEISSIVEDIEDTIDRIITLKLEESQVVHTIENLWE